MNSVNIIFTEKKLINRPTSNISVGDVVLIKDDTPVPRSKWRMGRVEGLQIGKDERTRGAKLKVVSPTYQKLTIYRPLQKLIALEINDETNGHTPKTSQPTTMHTPAVRDQPEGQPLLVNLRDGQINFSGGVYKLIVYVQQITQ